MKVWPVIVRELRQQSRQKGTFTMRCLGAGLATLVAGLLAPALLRDPNLGGLLFSGLHNVLFYSIWILVPLSAADCISRERRDGTLHIRVAPGLGLEVQHREPVLVERINAFFGYRAVARLALKQGPSARFTESRLPPPRPLKSEERRALDRQLADIEDPALRAALDRLGAAVIGSNRKS